MRQLDAWLNIAATVGYWHFFGFLIIDLFRVGSDKRHAPLTIALAGIFLTCGLHHAEIGAHFLAGDNRPYGVDIVVVSMQVIFAGTWTFLRYEALHGGRGDRKFSHLHPGWLVAGGIYYSAILSAVVAMLTVGAVRAHWGVVSNYGTYVAYTIIGWRLFSTQLYSKDEPWSLSGTVMAGYFANCALSHVGFASAVMAGYAELPLHHIVLDWVTFFVAVAFIVIAHRQKPPPKDMLVSEAQPI